MDIYNRKFENPHFKIEKYIFSGETNILKLFTETNITKNAAILQHFC